MQIGLHQVPRLEDPQRAFRPHRYLRPVHVVVVDDLGNDAHLAHGGHGNMPQPVLALDKAGEVAGDPNDLDPVTDPEHRHPGDS